MAVKDRRPFLHRDQDPAARRADRGPRLPFPDTGARPGRSRLTGRAALLALVLCSLVVALAYPIRQYVSQRAEIADLQREQAARRRQRVEDLRDHKARWQDDAYAEQQARAAAALRDAGARRASSSSTRRRPSRPPPSRSRRPPWSPERLGRGRQGRRRRPPAVNRPRRPAADRRRRPCHRADRSGSTSRKTGMEDACRLPADPRAPSRPTRTSRPSSSSSAVPPRGLRAHRAPLPVRAAGRGGDGAAAARRHALPHDVLPDVPAGGLGHRHAGGERRHEGDDGAAGHRPGAGRRLPGRARGLHRAPRRHRGAGAASRARAACRTG